MVQDGTERVCGTAWAEGNVSEESKEIDNSKNVLKNFVSRDKLLETKKSSEVFKMEEERKNAVLNDNKGAAYSPSIRNIQSCKLYPSLEDKWGSSSLLFGLSKILKRSSCGVLEESDSRNYAIGNLYQNKHAGGRPGRIVQDDPSLQAHTTSLLSGSAGQRAQNHLIAPSFSSESYSEIDSKNLIDLDVGSEAGKTSNASSVEKKDLKTQRLNLASRAVEMEQSQHYTPRKEKVSLLARSDSKPDANIFPDNKYSVPTCSLVQFDQNDSVEEQASEHTYSVTVPSAPPSEDISEASASLSISSWSSHQVGWTPARENQLQPNCWYQQKQTSQNFAPQYQLQEQMPLPYISSFSESTPSQRHAQQHIPELPLSVVKVMQQQQQQNQQPVQHQQQLRQACEGTWFAQDRVQGPALKFREDQKNLTQSSKLLLQPIPSRFSPWDQQQQLLPTSVQAMPSPTQEQPLPACTGYASFENSYSLSSVPRNVATMAKGSPNAFHAFLPAQNNINNYTKQKMINGKSVSSAQLEQPIVQQTYIKQDTQSSDTLADLSSWHGSLDQAHPSTLHVNNKNVVPPIDSWSVDIAGQNQQPPHDNLFGQQGLVSTSEPCLQSEPALQCLVSSGKDPQALKNNIRQIVKPHTSYPVKAAVPKNTMTADSLPNSSPVPSAASSVAGVVDMTMQARLEQLLVNAVGRAARGKQQAVLPEASDKHASHERAISNFTASYKTEPGTTQAPPEEQRNLPLVLSQWISSVAAMLPTLANVEGFLDQTINELGLALYSEIDHLVLETVGVPSASNTPKLEDNAGFGAVCPSNPLQNSYDHVVSNIETCENSQDNPQRATAHSRYRNALQDATTVSQSGLCGSSNCVVQEIPQKTMPDSNPGQPVAFDTGAGLPSTVASLRHHSTMGLSSALTNNVSPDNTTTTRPCCLSEGTRAKLADLSQLYQQEDDKMSVVTFAPKQQGAGHSAFPSSTNTNSQHRQKSVRKNTQSIFKTRDKDKITSFNNMLPQGHSFDLLSEKQNNKADNLSSGLSSSFKATNSRSGQLSQPQSAPRSDSASTFSSERQQKQKKSHYLSKSQRIITPGISHSQGSVVRHLYPNLETHSFHCLTSPLESRRLWPSKPKARRDMNDEIAVSEVLSSFIEEDAEELTVDDSAVAEFSYNPLMNSSVSSVFTGVSRASGMAAEPRDNLHHPAFPTDHNVTTQISRLSSSSSPPINDQKPDHASQAFVSGNFESCHGGAHPKTEEQVAQPPTGDNGSMGNFRHKNSAAKAGPSGKPHRVAPPVPHALIKQQAVQTNQTLQSSHRSSSPGKSSTKPVPQRPAPPPPCPANTGSAASVSRPDSHQGFVKRMTLVFDQSARMVSRPDSPPKAHHKSAPKPAIETPCLHQKKQSKKSYTQPKTFKAGAKSKNPNLSSNHSLASVYTISTGTVGLFTTTSLKRCSTNFPTIAQHRYIAAPSSMPVALHPVSSQTSKPDLTQRKMFGSATQSHFTTKCLKENSESCVACISSPITLASSLCVYAATPYKKCTLSSPEKLKHVEPKFTVGRADLGRKDGNITLSRLITHVSPQRPTSLKLTSHSSFQASTPPSSLPTPGMCLLNGPVDSHSHR
ncbi:hypothetical protein PoB_003886500 [Plakobranchus ocellatus]|uniref:Uncharacterized protein n=1 Tax=Plakobranchus ocellatus TaxID=259542 RepID=A0AAV4AZW6_9GAST|nr:hypothetical protein PoB_003886500 [Plakobranchus ocellatus]